MKLIPQLDRSEQLTAFAKTIVGKFIMALLFGIILYVTSYANTFAWPIIILVFSLFRQNRIRLLILFNILYVFFFNTLFDLRSTLYPNEHINVLNRFIYLRKLSEYFGAYTEKIISFLVVLLSFLIMYVFSKFLVTKNNKTAVIIYPMLMVFFLIFLYETTGQFIFFNLLCFGLLMVFMKIFWYWLYALTSRVETEGRSIIYFFESITPFFTHNIHRIHAIPRGISDLKSSQSATDDEFAKCQLSGLKLAIWASSCLIFSEVVLIMVFEKPRLQLQFLSDISIPSLNFTYPAYFAEYNKMNISIFEKWFVVIVRPGIFILKNFVGNVGIILAFLRLIGFRVRRDVYKPFMANNFYDFLSRIYYYYNCILVQFFFYPIFDFLFFFKLKKRIHLFLSVFLTLVIGGTILHFFRENIYLFKYGAWSAFQMIFGRMIYFCGIGFFAGISVIYRSNRKNSKVVSFLLYYIVYAFFFSMQGSLVRNTFLDRINYFLSLFFIQ